MIWWYLGDLEECHAKFGYNVGKSIWIPKHVIFKNINCLIMDWCLGDDYSYLSANFVGELEHERLDLEEFLNILTLPSTPSHEINTSSIVLSCYWLLCSMNDTHGQANNTRMIIQKFMSRVFDANNIGNNIGTYILVPWIMLNWWHLEMPLFKK
jgi:hypothetical protein